MISIALMKSTTGNVILAQAGSRFSVRYVWSNGTVMQRSTTDRALATRWYYIALRDASYHSR